MTKTYSDHIFKISRLHKTVKKSKGGEEKKRLEILFMKLGQKLFASRSPYFILFYYMN